MEKVKKFLNTKKGRIIISTVIFIVLAIMVLISILMREKITTITINQDVYQIINEEKIEYNTDVVIDSKTNTITQIKKDKKKMNLDSNPIYYKNDDKVIFPQNMSIVFPKSNVEQLKVNYFTTVNKEGKTIYIDRTIKKSPLYNCFLYDGDNTYFFIEETDIEFNDKTYKLSPLSYVILNYDNNIQIYDYKEDKIYYEEIGDKEVFAKTESYTINLSIDAVELGDKQRLLMKQLDYLKNLKESNLK